MSNPTIFDLPQAHLRQVSDNEIALDQRGDADAHPVVDDPIKLRFGAWHPADRDRFYIAAIGMDLLTGDDAEPHRQELGTIAFKLDPDPTIEIFLQDTATSDTDPTDRRRVRLTPSGLEFDVPVQFNAGTNISGSPSPAPSPVTQLTSPNGRFVTVQQDDGNLVVYDTTLGHGVGDPAAALWSYVTGRLR